LRDSGAPGAMGHVGSYGRAWGETLWYANLDIVAAREFVVI